MKRALGLALALAGCLARPPFSGEETLVDACVAPEGLRQVIDVPAKARFDFLWMIDDSGSMGPHQASLAANFRVVARFLHETLAGRADYRFAFTTTDLRSESARGAFRDGPPRLLPACDRDPAACEALAACEDVIVHGSGEPPEPDRWRFGPIIRSGTPEEGGNVGTTQAELEHVFDCAARVGVMGDSFEKGLEAARLALSCDGPNRALFAPCCVDRTAPDGTRLGSTYDADCAARLGPGEEPAFLRPNATLVVFFVSDAYDCSDPASNPGASERAICRHGPADGDDADDLPDAFTDAALCPGGPAACQRDECGGLAPEACYAKLCVVDRGDDANCVWHREALTPVSDYVDFLRSLKKEPERSLIVASVVGERAFLEAGGQRVEVTNAEGTPSEACQSTDAQGTPQFNTSEVSASCCPQGVCTGGASPTCETPEGLTAFTGGRYLEVAEAFGDNGLGCPPGATGDACLSICGADFARPLERVRDKLGRSVGRYCLERRPPCVVDTPDGPADCVSPEEFDDPANLTAGLTVSVECTQTAAEGGACEIALPKTRLGAGEYTVERAEACPERVAVVLTQPPPGGGRVILEAEPADPALRCP